jgi:hypothetical protein
MSSKEEPVRAAIETAAAYGVHADRCEVLQDGSTLVLRLSETLVARVVQDVGGPRQGTAWFERETRIVQHLWKHGAPVVPLHADIPPGPHERYGYPINFWRFVTRIDAEPGPAEVGRVLFGCHETLRSYAEPLPVLAILTEALDILARRPLFPDQTQRMLRDRLEACVEGLADLPFQALHGDAHLGNLMNTTDGLLLADWEDAFRGPLEWDLASIIWNALILENDRAWVDALLGAYLDAGGVFDDGVLATSLVARAAAVTAWYPILYPNPDAERSLKLERRIEWLWEAGGFSFES